MSIGDSITKKYGSLAKFAEAVWEKMPGIAHNHDHSGNEQEAELWRDVTSACQELLGSEEGQKAADLLRTKGFFSIAFPD